VPVSADSTTDLADEVRGQKVWAHWVWCKYALDFLRQDGKWKIWNFGCYELARAPFEENRISFAEKNEYAFALDLILRPRREGGVHGAGGRTSTDGVPPVPPQHPTEARARTAGAARALHRHLPVTRPS
jgi:hypothetical protein